MWNIIIITTLQPSANGWNCVRNDNKNLAEEWRLNHGPMAKVVRNVNELNAIDAATTEYSVWPFR